jgi:hypothetical protein
LDAGMSRATGDEACSASRIDERGHSSSLGGSGAPSFGGDGVEPSSLVVGSQPTGWIREAYEVFFREPLERTVERARLDGQCSAAPGLDVLNDGVSVPLARGERQQDLELDLAHGPTTCAAHIGFSPEKTRLALEHRHVRSPRPNGLAVLLRHDASGLGHVAEVVGDPRRQEVAERDEPERRMFAFERQLFAR